MSTLRWTLQWASSRFPRLRFQIETFHCLPCQEQHPSLLMLRCGIVQRSQTPLFDPLEFQQVNEGGALCLYQLGLAHQGYHRHAIQRHREFHRQLIQTSSFDLLQPTWIRQNINNYKPCWEDCYKNYYKHTYFNSSTSDARYWISPHNDVILNLMCYVVWAIIRIYIRQSQAKVNTRCTNLYIWDCLSYQWRNKTRMNLCGYCCKA